MKGIKGSGGYISLDQWGQAGPRYRYTGYTPLNVGNGHANSGLDQTEMTPEAEGPTKLEGKK